MKILNIVSGAVSLTLATLTMLLWILTDINGTYYNGIFLICLLLAIGILLCWGIINIAIGISIGPFCKGNQN
jgi:hypothetical protein